ncbi:MAG: helix-turn-helix transcriptional regulator [Pseudomonadota bacterium]
MFTEEYRSMVSVLSEIRNEQGVTQAELAALLGKPQSFVSKIENGDRRIDLIELIAIADALDVRPAAILERLEGAISRPISI